eukprot:INCI17181.4.p1 GENE.INCI17181.4~~INCI17181.4.p1  ORF type:complete len:1108 (-),score=263.76 INCI17181.4:127-3450(-)
MEREAESGAERKPDDQPSTAAEEEASTAETEAPPSSLKKKSSRRRIVDSDEDDDSDENDDKQESNEALTTKKESAGPAASAASAASASDSDEATRAAAAAVRKKLALLRQNRRKSTRRISSDDDDADDDDADDGDVSDSSHSDDSVTNKLSAATRRRRLRKRKAGAVSAKPQLQPSTPDKKRGRAGSESGISPRDFDFDSESESSDDSGPRRRSASKSADAGTAVATSTPGGGIRRKSARLKSRSVEKDVRTTFIRSKLHASSDDDSEKEVEATDIYGTVPTKHGEVTTSMSASSTAGTVWFAPNGIHCNHHEGAPFDHELATTDPITQLPLEKLHVDWVSPDGSLRMCYNLSTLKQIAAMNSTWMQPPHFRTPIELPMVIQIQTKFKVDATVYKPDEGPGQVSDEPGLEGASDQAVSEIITEISYSDRHRALLDSFFAHHMRGDFFVCPVCYHWLELRSLGCPELDFPHSGAGARPGLRSSDVSHAVGTSGNGVPAASWASERPRSQRLAAKQARLIQDHKDISGAHLTGRDSSSSEEEEDESILQSTTLRRKKHTSKSGTESSSDDDAEQRAREAVVRSKLGHTDPMALLSQLSVNQAAKMCFRTMKSLREHLNRRHKMKLLPVAMNDFFSTYKVRAPDGLVQRYMHRIKLPLKVYWHGSHGHMEESHQEFADRLFRRTRFNAISFRIDHPAEDDSDEFFDGADTTAAGSNSARATGFPEDYFKKSSVFVSELAERYNETAVQDDFDDWIAGSNEDSEGYDASDQDSDFEAPLPPLLAASVRGGIKNVVNSGSKKRKSVQRRDDKSSNDDGAADVEHDSSNEVGAQSSSSSSEDEWAENESSDEDALAVAEAAAQIAEVQDKKGLSRSEARARARDEAFKKKHGYQRSDWDFTETNEAAATAAAAEAVQPIVKGIQEASSSSSDEDEDPNSEAAQKKRARRLAKAAARAKAAVAAEAEKKRAAEELMAAKRQAQELQRQQQHLNTRSRRTNARQEALEQRIAKFRELRAGNRDVAMPDIPDIPAAIVEMVNGKMPAQEVSEDTNDQSAEDARAELAKANFEERRQRMLQLKRAAATDRNANRHKLSDDSDASSSEPDFDFNGDGP